MYGAATGAGTAQYEQHRPQRLAWLPRHRELWHNRALVNAALLPPDPLRLASDIVRYPRMMGAGSHRITRRYSYGCQDSSKALW